ncbi:MAG: hypothetical protein HOD92_19960 [Deltaproteobacteria bacterium]|nr:hypothetical protein [Deltaproteobacteria bacterium]
MNTLKENNFQPWPNLTPEEKQILQQICRDSIIEPFEGRKGLETIQKTRTNIEKGIGKLKNFSKSTSDKIKDSKWLETSKSKINNLITDVKKGSKSSQIPDILNKLNFITDTLPKSSTIKFKNLEKKLVELTQDLQKATRNKYQDLGTKAREAALIYTKKGLELLLYEDTESWILDKANKILNKTNINTIEDIRKLSTADRKILIEKLYPYNSPNYSIFIQKYDSTINITLGAIVATNFPGTGIAVGLFNIGKTLLKLGNRINIMSSIYGYQVSSPSALFKVSAKILKSMDDWENNINHVPLSIDVLDDLYSEYQDDDESAFQNLLNAAVKKEAYIAIPGIGMISLGKINLDDLKMDILVKHLVQNYFNKSQLILQINEIEFQSILADYQLIYGSFMKHDYFQKSRKASEQERLQQSNKKWQTHLQILAGIDLALESASTNLNRFTSDIYQKICHLKIKSEKQKIIQNEIETLLKMIEL